MRSSLCGWAFPEGKKNPCIFLKNPYFFFEKKYRGASYSVAGRDCDEPGQLLAPCPHLQPLNAPAPRSHQLDSRGGPRCRVYLLYCAALLHCFTALLYSTAVLLTARPHLQPSRPSCRFLLHCFTALLYCTAVLLAARPHLQLSRPSCRFRQRTLVAEGRVH